MIYCLNPECNHINQDQYDSCQQCQSPLLLKQCYHAIKLIGQGGFGRTFLAQDLQAKHQPRCVIKQLLPVNEQKAEKSWQLFQEEAKGLQILGQHSRIPELIDYFQADNKYYIIQEYVDGENLAQELQKGGNFPQEKVIKLLQEILPLLKYIHQRKIIHRDIKPENIIKKIDNQKHYLVDFGASKLLSDRDPFQTATVIGSAEYIAPEQGRGKALFASDIYSLGVTCIHLLTNRSPFDLIDFNNQWVWQDYVTEKINPRLVKIIDKMIAFSLNQRYQKVEEVIADLAKITTEKILLKWKIVGVLGTVAIAFITLGNILNFLEKKPVTKYQKQPKPGEQINPPPPPGKSTPEEIITPEYAYKEARQKEEEAILLLVSLQKTQEQFYQQTGKFLPSDISAMVLPLAEDYIIQTKPITEHRIAIVALAKRNNLRNFLVTIWGGREDIPTNKAKISQYQPKDGDLGVLSSPLPIKLSSKSDRLPKYSIKYNFCESSQPEQKFPNFDSLNLGDSIPLSYQELACPPGYLYSFTATQVMGKLAAKPLPAIVYDRNGNILSINEGK